MSRYYALNPLAENGFEEIVADDYNGKTWVSTVDNNVWEPSVYGWDEV